MTLSLKNMILAGMMTAAYGTSLSAQDAPANGRNVHLVNYTTSQGQSGSFFQEGRSEWRQDMASGNKAHYREMNRDEWSVYLRDEARGIEVQLDLFTHKVMTSTAQRPRMVMAEIQDASSKSNGRIARMVSFTDSFSDMTGRFTETGNGMWVERTARGERQLRERARDDWSVYLTDESRGTELQLDLHTRTVYVSNGHTSHRPIYQIARAF